MEHSARSQNGGAAQDLERSRLAQVGTGRVAVVRMARSIWNGSISFGLVNIPINLVSAIEPHRVGFHEFEQGTKNRIHYRRVAGNTDREVPWEKIEKGFEVSKDRYVMLTDEELAAAEPEKSRTIDIEQFVPLAEIDPVNWDKTYYVAPDSEAAAKAYGLLRQAMQQQGRVAIGRFVMRTKGYVVCVRPMENILALSTMYFPDEVRSTKDLTLVPRKANVGKQELALATQLIDAMAGHWDPSAYKDTFRQHVMELVRRKDKGEEIVVDAPAAEPGKVIDLMAALKATLAGTKGGKAAPKPTPRGRHATAARPNKGRRAAESAKPTRRRATA
jgi:DNA end-binding protein Ku